MDRSTPIVLVKETMAQDSLGQFVPTETTRNVFAKVRSISRSEWQSAGELGLNPQYEVTMFKYDYEGEKVVVLNDNRYSVYRTYEGTDDLIDLYLEHKVGV